MDPVEAARRGAESLHDAAMVAGVDPWRPIDVAMHAAAARGLEVWPVAPGDPLLLGGRARLDPQAGAVIYGETGSAAADALLIGHEVAHVVVHGGHDPVVTFETDPSRAGESGTAVERLVDYGRRERREVQADLFARELVIPRPWVRLQYLGGLSAAAIAARLAVEPDVVSQQLLDALLLPRLAAADVEPVAQRPRRPDPKQDLAVRHRGRPFLLQAGPGTGKTRTLIRRVASLLDDGADPGEILVLTFSNKAAGELMDRLAKARPGAASRVWTGTFHSFGLDLIRRFHDRLDLPASPGLVDKATANALLEEVLPTLPLRHHRNLWDPTLDLSDMLGAVSRAKDEVVDATGYRRLGEAMLAAAADDDARTRAERCLEVAALYEAYERIMRERKFVDFGDLVMLPARLAEADEVVRRHVAARHRHVLVDEYQDVNRASVRLLRSLAADGGERLWAVGDARQSVYRFRGASSVSMARFGTDFPGAVIERLGINYRSGQEIVDAFSAFANAEKGMLASRSTARLEFEAARGVGGRLPELRVAGTPEDEISVVAAAVVEARDQGTTYRDQAVMCASNGRLNDLAEGLEARGIPVLYLGSLFERDEVRDLLGFLSLCHDPFAAGLARIATLPGFEMTLDDVAIVGAHLRETSTTPLAWLETLDNIADLSPKGRASLDALRRAVGGFAPREAPWRIAAGLVLDRLGWARAIAQGDTLRDRMRGVALWQLLNFCRSLPQEGAFPTAALFDRVRRLVLLNEERDLRHFPTAALQIDAVRLLTIHGSKGLEFDTVHVPSLVVTGLPRNNRPPACPPPDGLIAGAEGMTGPQAAKAGHDEEEECLFFVALSRARDRLHLYASSEQANGRRRNPSPFLARLGRTVVTVADPGRRHPEAAPVPPAAVAIAWEAAPAWSDGQVASFERCPLRFFYTHVLRLGGRRTETAFMRMHDVVQAMVQWLDENFDAAGARPETFVDQFETTWVARGPVTHGYAGDYRRIAARLVDYLMETRAGLVRVKPEALRLLLPGGEIVVTPHDVVQGDDGAITVRRMGTGRPRAREGDAIEYALLKLAAEGRYGVPVTVEAVHLTSETVTPVPLDPAKAAERRAKVEEHLAAIRAGLFPPKGDDRTCPRCPHFFVCEAKPAGGLAARFLR